VEYHTIEADRETQKVTFGVNDLKSFSVEELTKALGSRYGKGMKVLQSPSQKR